MISLEQKERVDALRIQYGHKSSSHAFTSLYVWQDEMGLELQLEQDMFAVKSRLHGTNSWFFPCGAGRAKEIFLAAHLEEPDFTLHYVREEDVQFAEHAFPGRFQFTEQEEDSEYLYDRDEQQQMRGRRFEKLRNSWHRARRDHQLEVVSLDEALIPSAAAITAEWKKTHFQPGVLGIRDEEASMRLLRHWNQLDVQGILLYVDGEPYALTAGYLLSDDTFDLCMAKQKEMGTGISVYARWALYQTLPEHVRIINAEEDLGMEGLRMMKHCMQPTGMIRMFCGKVL
ncbi:MAG: phosphatidylglycerol lysyltransferase domain-containing protein [Eubacteriales bacterium]|nr:phosphatidylglycerol lysyltransferase domain-containing protein [Eubacteriales bacterium]